MNQDQQTVSSNTAPTQPPSDDKFKQFKDRGNYFLGWTLIGCALVDAVVDPFKVLTSPALLGADKISDILK